MTFNAIAVAVFIASPDDVAEARDAVENVIHRWNTDHSLALGVILLPLRWESGSVAELGNDPQLVTNRQLVEHADIMIGVFDARLGTKTPRASSGTVEELNLAIENGIPTHVYFSTGPLDRALDIDQLRALDNYKRELSRSGLLGEYGSIHQLETKIRSALERDIRRLTSTQPQPSKDRALANIKFAIEPVRLSANERPSGKIILEAINSGFTTAEDFRIELAPLDEGEAPISRLDDVDSISLAPEEVFRFHVYSVPGMAKNWQITSHWREGEFQFSETCNVKVFE